MLKKQDWLIALALAAFAAALNFFSMASFAYPGESAHLLAVWNGLDVAASTPYPLTRFLTGLFGGGNVIAPVAGTVATFFIYLLVTSFVRMRAEDGETAAGFAVSASRIAGVTASLVFVLLPAVRLAASHVEPAIVDVAWLLAALALSLAWLRTKGALAALCPLAMGALWGVGAADGVIFWQTVPLALCVVVLVPLRLEKKPTLPVILFLAAMVTGFLVTLGIAGEMGEAIGDLGKTFAEEWRMNGWLGVFGFSVLPTLVALVASRRTLGEKSTLAGWIFHLALAVASILAVATPFSAGELLKSLGVLPVAASAFAAVLAGYLLAYLWQLGRGSESTSSRLFGFVIFGILAFVYAFSSVFELFSFDTRSGGFADAAAEIALDDLGERTWLISDGRLDNHYRLVAARRGKKLNIVSLGREGDELYMKELTRLVKEEKLGGEACDDLVRSLALGLVPFVQDWFRTDPEVAKKAVIVGAADLWYSVGIKAVPEFMFFGADPERLGDGSHWNALADKLVAPKGWGSYMLWRERNPVDLMCLELRRHLGLVENNRGVWLEDNGRREEGFAAYERVLEEIDADNICALINIFEMTSKDESRKAKHGAYERRLKMIVEDKNRRYRLMALSSYYGYIRNPSIIIKYGYEWARSGRPGEALNQMRRAIDLVPDDRRGSLLNMMAALYASNDDRTKSREVYEKVLEKNANDHDALVGLMRLSMMDGDSSKALGYLERAVEAGGDDPRVEIERAMVALMKNDLPKAKAILRQITDTDKGNLRAWSLMASVTMQQCDAEKTPEGKVRFERELEKDILPSMEKLAHSADDYYVKTTRAFLLMRKGGEDKRREARDAFAVAAQSRPDISSTQDLVIGLDISLNDVEAAEQHAKDVLRRNRKAPLANYVMGSVAMRKGDYVSAEAYLHRAADAERAVPMALNDLAETYRRLERYGEAEVYARKAVAATPNMYVVYETLASILLAQKKDAQEAEQLMEKAIELSKASGNGRVADVRMYITYARILLLKGDRNGANRMLREKVQSHVSELSEFERKEYDELLKNVR